MRRRSVGAPVAHERARAEPDQVFEQRAALDSGMGSEAETLLHQAHDRVRDHGGIVVASEVATLHPLAKRLRERERQPVAQAGPFACAGCDHARVRERGRKHARVPLRVLEDRLQGLSQPAGEVRRGRMRAHALHELGCGLVGEGEKRGALVVEVQVEGARGDGRGARDVLRPGRVVAALHEQASRRV